MVFKFHENCVFLCVDVKHRVKVGESNHPVAAAERGERCSLVVMQALKLQTMIKFSLVPSVSLVVGIQQLM